MSATFTAPAGGRGIKITEERKELFRQCLADGWPFIQIQQTHNVSWHTLNKFFPGQGMDRSTAAALGAASRAANGQSRG